MREEERVLIRNYSTTGKRESGFIGNAPDPCQGSGALLTERGWGESETDALAEIQTVDGREICFACNQ